MATQMMAQNAFNANNLGTEAVATLLLGPVVRLILPLGLTPFTAIAYSTLGIDSFRMAVTESGGAAGDIFVNHANSSFAPAIVYTDTFSIPANGQISVHVPIRAKYLQVTGAGFPGCTVNVTGKFYPGGVG